MASTTGSASSSTLAVLPWRAVCTLAGSLSTLAVLRLAGSTSTLAAPVELQHATPCSPPPLLRPLLHPGTTPCPFPHLASCTRWHARTRTGPGPSAGSIAFLVQFVLRTRQIAIDFGAELTDLAQTARSASRSAVRSGAMRSHVTANPT
eukprot:644726-Rhodomonas_salina.1